MNRKVLTIIVMVVFLVGSGGYVIHYRAVKAEEIRKAEEAKKEAERQAWIARTVECPNCKNRFTPENNKAPMLGAAAAGAATGGATGAAGGAYAGSGTGIAVGGVGAFPGAGVGALIGGLGGAIVGGIGGAWYSDRRVKCPSCNNIFTNPKN